MNRILTALAAISAVMAAPLAAQAQATVTRSPATAPALGTTIRGNAATVFSISATGTVTRVSGNAIRLSSASVTTPTLTIHCGLLNLSGLCALRYVRVTITPVAGSGPATISKLRVGSLSGTSYRSGSAPSEGASLVFDLNPLGLLSSATLRLGMDVTLAANAASGNHSYDYIVTVALVQ